MILRELPTTDTSHRTRLRHASTFLMLAAALSSPAALAENPPALHASGQQQHATAGSQSPTPTPADGQSGKSAQEEGNTTKLETVVVSSYVPVQTNSANKSQIPLLDTPQSVTVISRAQMNLLDWQSLGQAVRYTAGVVGDSFGADPRYDWLTQRGFSPTVYINGLRAPIGSVKSTGIDLFGFQTVEVLKGPSSALYGSQPPGGIVNLTSRQPEDTFYGEGQLQYGSYASKQANLDVTGPLGDNPHFMGRFTAVYYDRGIQRRGVSNDRYYVAPSFTWRPSRDTTLTFLSYFQHDAIDGDGAGFLPAYGVLLPNPVGSVSTSTNLGDTQYNKFKRDQYGIGYEFRHRFNDTWNFQQNLMYFSNKSHKLEVYGTGLVTDAAGVPTDYRTVTRANFPFDEKIRATEVDSRLHGNLDFGQVTHKLLVGLSFRHYNDDAAFGFAAAPPIDLFDPVYGMPITTPPLSTPYLQQVQKETGLYAQDVMEVNHWVVTLGGREDYVDTSNFGTGTVDHKFTYHAGVNYVLDSGLAPYVSYATSFQPVAGADFAGHAFQPTVGSQTEVGLKFQPTSLSPGKNLLVTLAAYDLNQKNVLTPDPAHLLFNVQTGKVRVRGFELEGVAQFNERLSFNFAYTVMSSEVTSSNGPDLGKELPVTPRRTGSALVDYTVRSGVLSGLGASLGFRYIGPSYGDPANTLQAPGRVLWDSTIHYATGPDWEFDLSASNLFDKKYVARCSSLQQCFFGNRRVVNLTATRRF